MGFFDLFKKSTVDESQWPQMVYTLGERFEHVRDTWFNRWNAYQRDESGTILNPRLKGVGKMSAVTFQMQISLEFLKEKKYMDPDGTARFMKELYKHICGDRAKEYLEYQDRYAHHQERRDMIKKFLDDMLEFTKQKTGGHPEQGEGLRMTEKYIWSTELELADCFGDKKTVVNLKAKIMD